MQLSVHTYSGSTPSRYSYSDGFAYWGYVAAFGLAAVNAINPAVAEFAQPFVEDALGVMSPPSVPETVGGFLANAYSGFKDLIWDTLISPITTPIKSGISSAV